jgi:hypothetical protein
MEFGIFYGPNFGIWILFFWNFPRDIFPRKFFDGDFDDQLL